MAKKAEEIINDMQTELDTYFQDSKSESMIEPDVIQQSTGIEAIDLLTGGIALGTLTQITGYPGSFKSTIASQIAAHAKRLDARTPIVYMDTEVTMQAERINRLGLMGVKPRFNYTIETILSDIQVMYNFKESKKLLDIPAVMIWDSVVNTPTKAGLATLDPTKTIGLLPKIISQKLPQLLITMKLANISLIAINQFRDKMDMGMFAPPSDLKHLASDKVLPGGNSLAYNTAQLFQCAVKTSYTGEKETDPYGKRATIIYFKTVKNKFTMPDNHTIELVVDPITGVDNLLTNYEVLKKQGKINASGWSSLKDAPEHKFRLKSIHETYETNLQFKEAFDKVVTDTYKELKSKLLSEKPVELCEKPVGEVAKELDELDAQLNEMLNNPELPSEQ